VNRTAGKRRQKASDIPPQKRGKRRNPLPALLVLLSVVLVGGMAAGWLFLGCFGGEEATNSRSTDSSAEEATTRLKIQTGAPLKVGDVLFEVDSFHLVVVPGAPDHTLTEGMAFPLGEGDVFYQARVRIKSRGRLPVRVDPNDFQLVADDERWQVDPGRTGPPPRTLRYRASLDLVVTFRAPVREGASLLYSPAWHPYGIIVEEMLAPKGETSEEMGEK